MFESAYSAIPDLSAVLSLVSKALWVAIGLAAFFVWKKKHLALSTKLLALFLGLQIILLFADYQIDLETVALAEEKIVIIEIDDFWNLEHGYFNRYGYSIENHESVISLIEKHNYSATLGASPYIFIEETQDIYSLSDDEEMVGYLWEKKMKGHEIAMHGYAHCRNDKFCPHYEENYLNILQGKKELDNLFNQSTTTYLPPGNFWDDAQYLNVKNAGFLIIPNTFVSKPYWDGGVLMTQRGYDVVEIWDWYGVDNDHYDVGNWVAEYEKSDIFIVQLHCNTFDSEEKLDDLEQFLDYLENDGAKVVTYQQAYSLLSN